MSEAMTSALFIVGVLALCYGLPMFFIEWLPDWKARRRERIREDVDVRSLWQAIYGLAADVEELRGMMARHKIKDQRTTPRGTRRSIR